MSQFKFKTFLVLSCGFSLFALHFTLLPTEQDQHRKDDSLSPEVQKSLDTLNDAQAPVESKSEALKVLQKDKKLLPKLVVAFQDPSSRIRLEAAKALSEMRDPPENLLEALLRLLDDPVTEVGQASAITLRKIGGDKLGNLLAKKIKSEDARERKVAAIAFGVTERKSAIPLLTQALKDKEWEVRKAAVGGLVHLGAKDSCSPMLSLLQKEGCEEVRAALAYTMGYFKYSSAVPTLEKLLQAKYNRYRHITIKALARIAEVSSTAAQSLKGYLHDEDSWVRYYALEGLVRAYEAKVQFNVTHKDIAHLAKDELWVVRAALSELLGKAGTHEELPLLIPLLSDPEEAVVYNTVQSLLAWKNKEVIPQLIDHLDKLEGEGFNHATKILKQLTRQKIDGADESETKKKWEEWWKRNRWDFQMPKRRG